MSWNNSDELSPWQTLLAVLFLCAVFAAITSFERCGAAVGWLHVRSRPWLLAGLVTLAGCAGAQQDMRRLCVTADAAGRMLTISGAALREVHDLDVDAAWARECSSGSVEERVVCRHRVVDDLADKYRERYRTAEQSVAAQHALADALEASGICKDGAK
jgi:hypothetical protein